MTIRYFDHPPPLTNSKQGAMFTGATRVVAKKVFERAFVPELKRWQTGPWNLSRWLEQWLFNAVVPSGVSASLNDRKVRVCDGS